MRRYVSDTLRRRTRSKKPTVCEDEEGILGAWEMVDVTRMESKGGSLLVTAFALGENSRSICGLRP